MSKYYFTSDKWYGPVPDGLDDRYYISEEMLQYHNYPSDSIDPRLSEWAGQVKEEGKDFVFKEWCDKYEECNCNDIKCQQHWIKTAVPIAGPFDDLDEELLCKPMPTQAEWDKEHQKQMITEIMDADQRDGVYEGLTIEEKCEELWDEHSVLIGSDIDDLQYFAGRVVLTESDYKKLISSLTEYLKTKP